MPFSKAVEDILTEWTSYVENSIPVLMEWYSEVSMGREVNSYFCHIIQSSAKNGVPKSSELPAIIAEAQKSDGYNAVSKNQFENALKVLNTDERIEQFLSLRLDPGVNTAVGYVRDEVKCFKAVLASGKLKDVLDKIESLEKDNLSWSKTVGPACVAIIRLGKRSAGKDLEKLAEYARKHARRPV